MRRSTHDITFIQADDGTTLGIGLGFDFCAEHEFGIKGIKEGLGLTGDDGLPGRTMTKLPPVIAFHPFKRTPRKPRGATKALPKEACAYLVVSNSRSDTPDESKNIKDVLACLCRDGMNFYTEKHDSYYRPERDDVLAAWDSDGFAVVVRGDDNVKKLKEIADALANQDLAILSPTSAGFSQGGLGAFIASRIPEEVKKNMLEADLDQKRLEKAANDTGIKELLAKSNKSFYALSPQWTDESRTTVRFWLNPMDQRNNNYGWYTVEELQAWARDEGPIPMAKNEKTAKPGR